MHIKSRKLLVSIGLLSLLFVFSNYTTKETKPPVFLENIKDLVYGTGIDTIDKLEPMTMDIYFPKGATKGKKYPFVMMIHGGGFRTGNKDNMAKTCERLAGSGFIAATINYRMGWNVRDPSSRGNGELNTQSAASYRAFQDANAAMRFVVSKAADYGIDTSKIFTGGGSAGAITALALAYVNDDYEKRANPDFFKAFGGLSNAGNNLTNGYRIKGICSMWGALPDSTLITRDNVAPTIFFHGTADKTVPSDIGPGVSKSSRAFGSLCLYRQMKKIDAPAIVHLSIDGKHGPEEYKGNNFPIDQSICFFKSILDLKHVESNIYYGLDKSCKN